jgi:hypothetical protein
MSRPGRVRPNSEPAGWPRGIIGYGETTINEAAGKRRDTPI